MAMTKVTVSIDSDLLKRLDRLVAKRIFPSPSRAVQEAVRDKLERMGRSRLARACAKLDSLAERAMAEEGRIVDAGSWPPY
jgi:metal-responsive CopG/Arc/MetJ family transcriptional regulator